MAERQLSQNQTERFAMVKAEQLIAMFFWVAFQCGCLIAQEAVSEESAVVPPATTNANVREIDFEPPKDAILTKQVRIFGVDEVIELKLSKHRIGRENTIRIPLKNETTEKIVIKDISVSCGCMTMIAQSLTLMPNSTTELYLRVRPKESGGFRKRATLNLSNSTKLVLVLKAKADRLFAMHCVGPFDQDSLDSAKNL